MIETVKMSSKGQIVIPEGVRKHLQLKEGSKLVLIERGKKIVLEPEKEFMKTVNEIEKEKLGWLMIAEKSLARDWSSKEEDEAWKHL